MLIWFIIFIIFWLVCAVIGHGLIFGYFQGEYPNRGEEYYIADMRISLIPAILLGPFDLIAALIWLKFKTINNSGFKHGLKFW